MPSLPAQAGSDLMILGLTRLMRNILNGAQMLRMPILLQYQAIGGFRWLWIITAQQDIFHQTHKSYILSKQIRFLRGVYPPRAESE